MTENMQDMSATTEAAVTPQKEQDSYDEQPREPLARPPAEELEVARELVRSAREPR